MVTNLRTYLGKTYTKKDLVSILADAVTDGELPVFPDEEAVSQHQAIPRGRPSRRDTEEYITHLSDVLRVNYPHSIDVKALAYMAGIGAKTLQRWASRPDVLARLPVEYREYFTRIIKRNSTTRLSTAERAVLDLHNYLWTLTIPEARLPFHSWHAPLWGLKRGSSNPTYNAAERARLRSPLFLAALDAAALPPPVYVLPEGPYGAEPGACSVTVAISQKKLPRTVNTIWTMLLAINSIPSKYIPKHVDSNIAYDPRSYSEALEVLLGVTL